MSVSILPWSKTHKARYNWKCKECQGLIPKGTIYRRYVMRDGEFGKGRRYSHRVHLDCEAPWWQPVLTHRCLGIAGLPHRLPTQEEDAEQRGGVTIHIHGKSDADGGIVLILPHELSMRILHAPAEEVREASLANIQSAFELLLRAFENAAGNRKRAKMLSNALSQLQVVMEVNEPPLSQRPPGE